LLRFGANQVIGKTISHYRIIEKIGEGGMGVVYKAEDTKLRRIVALKFLPAELTRDKEAKERFVQEAQAAAALDHTNICTVHEIDEVEGKTFISMAYIKGQSLKEKIASGPIELKEVLDISIHTAEGLKEAHENGIVHRDIKPANIMLTKKGKVKIMDFGLAKLSWGVDLTKTAAIMGTVAYMSPEQASGEKIDHRTDIWSLGCVLYEMLAGQRPFKSTHDQAAIYSILNEEPEPIASLRKDLPVGLEMILHACLQKDPCNRYRDVEALLSDLRSIDLEDRAQVLTALQAKEEPPSIAVLPFVNMSADPENEYFSDGLSEAILNSLTKIKDFKVVARTSAFSFKGKDVDIRDVGKQLDVNKVLEGSVQKAGNRLRITAQLINVADGYHLWSERFDRNMDDIFAIQDEISLAIVDNLRLELLKCEKTKLIKRHTNDPEAYNFYLQGRYFYNKRTEEDMKRSVEYFERALEKDPKFALPYAGLADACATFGFYHWWPYQKARSKAREFASKGLEVDDSVGETHAAYANYICWFEFKWEEAEKEFIKAMELSPSDVEARHMYAHLLESLGRFDEAIAEMGKALELEPLSIILNHCMGNILFFSGDYDGAIDLFQKTIEMDPSFPIQYLWLGRAYLQNGKIQKAIEIFEKGTEFPTVNACVLGGLGLAYSISGREKDARKILDQLNELSKEKYVDPYFIAYVYMGLGDRDKTFQCLEKSFEVGDMYLLYLLIDPTFAELHDDPRFKALLKKISLN
jgi:serine/threonine protein kinase/Flp pilus assembly protein TadD